MYLVLIPTHLSLCILVGQMYVDRGPSGKHWEKKTGTLETRRMVQDGKDAEAERWVPALASISLGYRQWRLYAHVHGHVHYVPEIVQHSEFRVWV